MDPGSFMQLKGLSKVEKTCSTLLKTPFCGICYTVAMTVEMLHVSLMFFASQVPSTRCSSWKLISKGGCGFPTVFLQRSFLPQQGI